jgi:hypothetical protein
MTWFLIIVLAATTLLALLALLGLLAYHYDEASVEQARIEREVRTAERRLHDIARDSFESMLQETRAGHVVRGQ